MKKNYIGLWLILAVAFVLFALVSFMPSFNIFGHEFKSSGIADNLFLKNESHNDAFTDISGAAAAAADVSATESGKPVPVDTAAQTILLVGDSMLDGLSPRMAAYCEKNGHKLYSVIWYSSTSEIWGQSSRLKKYIEDIKPTQIFICLGSNELFVKDIAARRGKYVKKIVSDFGSVPYLWIGPPNWKPDTGINDLIAANVASGSFFLSNGMKFERRKDGAHPTKESAAKWLDSIVRWMPAHSNHPIRMHLPDKAYGRATRTFIHQPDDK